MSDAVPVPAVLVERLTVVLERVEVSLRELAPAADRAAASLLTLAEVARRLRKSERSVQRLVNAGRLRKVPGCDKGPAFRPSDVAIFLAGDAQAKRGRLP